MSRFTARWAAAPFGRAKLAIRDQKNQKAFDPTTFDGTHKAVMLQAINENTARKEGNNYAALSGD